MRGCSYCRKLLPTAAVCPEDGAPVQRVELLDVPASLASRFSTLRPFAAGGMGSLYVAVPRGEERRFILKLIRPGASGAPADTLARLERELQRQTTLRLPFSTLAVETGTTDGLVWLLRDFVAGQSFASRIRRRGGVPLSEALAVIGQAATALDELHRAGLLHRAVEPRHMLLAGAPVPELRFIDVGVVGTLASEGALEIVGSAGYVAPEVLAGKPSTFRSDLYGLGCVFYEALGGTLPKDLGADDPLPAIPARDVPPPVWSLLTAILAHDPRRRPFSAQHVRRALEPFLPPGTPSAKRAASGPPARSPSAAAAARSSVPPVPPPAALRPSARPPNPADPTQELSSRDLQAASAAGHASADERSRELRLRATRSAPAQALAPDRTQEISLSEVSEAEPAPSQDLWLPPAAAMKTARVPDPTQELSLSDVEAAQAPVAPRARAKPDPAHAGKSPRSSAPPVPPSAARPVVTSSTRASTPGVQGAKTTEKVPTPSEERAKLRSRDNTAPFAIAQAERAGSAAEVTSAQPAEREPSSLGAAAGVEEGSVALASTAPGLGPSRSSDAASDTPDPAGAPAALAAAPADSQGSPERVATSGSAGAEDRWEKDQPVASGIPGELSVSPAAGSTSVMSGLAEPEANSAPPNVPADAALVGAVAPASTPEGAAAQSPHEVGAGPAGEGATTQPSELAAAAGGPGRFDVESLFEDSLGPERSPLTAASSDSAGAPAEAPSPVVRRSVRDQPFVGIQRSPRPAPRVWPMLAGAAVLGLVALSLSSRTCGGSDEASRHMLKPAPASSPDVASKAAPGGQPPPPSAANEPEPKVAAATPLGAPSPVPPPAGDAPSHAEESEAREPPVEPGRTLTAAQARPVHSERGGVIAYQGGPADGVDHKAKARDLYTAGKYREAAEAYERATQRTPSDAGAYAGLGASALALNQADRAIAAYQRALQLSPNVSGFHAALGRAYLQKGDRGRAAAAYRKALDLDPKNTAARTGLTAVSH